eukprot:TRINITY_DN17205_c0_g1_i1.p1 TRINITY_DN17205_c0_g1~~TRINITY_DN17205_c0_g1_i1.p1  ORF type:complete len:604 (-),score=177.45 TRINITY_DN17205_c0_g1_i1:155-1966(-)
MLTRKTAAAKQLEKDSPLNRNEKKQIHSRALKERAIAERLVKDIKKAIIEKNNDELLAEHPLLAEEIVETMERNKEKRNLQLQRKSLHFDSERDIRKKIQSLASLIKAKKRKGGSVVVCTGAGISTRAGIPDFRGPNGVWTLGDKGKETTMYHKMSDVIPTTSHFILAEMCREGLVDYVVSQNVDGLHLRANHPWDQLIEIHGNVFLEECISCGYIFLHNEVISTHKSTKGNRKAIGIGKSRKKLTGRKCDNCDGDLKDSVVHFGQKIRELEFTSQICSQADLLICLGSSLKIVSHYGFMWKRKKGSDLAIVNLMWTCRDKNAKIKINGLCDTVMTGLAQELNINKIPSYDKANDMIANAPPICKTKEEDDEEEEDNDSNNNDNNNKNNNDHQNEETNDIVMDVGNKDLVEVKSENMEEKKEVIVDDDIITSNACLIQVKSEESGNMNMIDQKEAPTMRITRHTQNSSDGNILPTKISNNNSANNDSTLEPPSKMPRLDDISTEVSFVPNIINPTKQEQQQQEKEQPEQEEVQQHPPQFLKDEEKIDGIDNIAAGISEIPTNSIEILKACMPWALPATEHGNRQPLNAMQELGFSMSRRMKKR